MNEILINAFREMYLKEKVAGEVKYLRSGDRMSNAALGRTLKQVAINSNAFYNGSLAHEIVADVREHGTVLLNIHQ